jgi:acyl-homoserine lactone acylase PvdQ
MPVNNLLLLFRRLGRGECSGSVGPGHAPTDAASFQRNTPRHNAMMNLRF